jgi:glutamine synthetase
MMVKTGILPNAIEYAGNLASQLASVKEVLGEGAISTQKATLSRLMTLIDELKNGTNELEKELEAAHHVEEILEHAKAYRDKVIPAMNKVRQAADEIETILPADYYPYPTYTELLFKH